MGDERVTERWTTSQCGERCDTIALGSESQSAICQAAARAHLSTPRPHCLALTLPRSDTVSLYLALTLSHVRSRTGCLTVSSFVTVSHRLALSQPRCATGPRPHIGPHIGPSHWPLTLAPHTAPSHWPLTLAPHTGPSHWPLTLALTPVHAGRSFRSAPRAPCLSPKDQSERHSQLLLYGGAQRGNYARRG